MTALAPSWAGGWQGSEMHPARSFLRSNRNGERPVAGESWRTFPNKNNQSEWGLLRDRSFSRVLLEEAVSLSIP